MVILYLYIIRTDNLDTGPDDDSEYGILASHLLRGICPDYTHNFNIIPDSTLIKRVAVYLI